MALFPHLPVSMILRMRPSAPSALLLLILVCLTASLTIIRPRLTLPTPTPVGCRNCWHTPEATNNNNNSTEATHSPKTIPEIEDVAEEIKRELLELEAKAEEPLREAEWMRTNETILEKEKIVEDLESRLQAGYYI